jgi:hypothetical protein
LCEENRPDKGREDKFLQGNLEKAAKILVAMRERLPMAHMWVRDANRYMNELYDLRKEHRGSDSSPESNNDSSSGGSNSGVARLPWVKVQRMLTDFGHTEDENMDGDTQIPTGIRFPDRASEPSSPPSVKIEPTPPKSEGEQANIGTPGFTALNHTRVTNGNAVNETPPKPTGGHAGVLASTDFQSTYPNTQYDMPYQAQSNGSQSYPTQNMYPHVQSQERAVMGPSTYNQQPQHMNTVPVPQPPMGAYHAVPAPAQYPFRDFENAHFTTNFSSGNDPQFDWPFPMPYDYAYNVVANGAQHQNSS